MLVGQVDESCCGFLPPPTEPSETNRVVQRPAQRVVIEPLGVGWSSHPEKFPVISSTVTALPVRLSELPERSILNSLVSPLERVETYSSAQEASANHSTHTALYFLFIWSPSNN